MKNSECGLNGYIGLLLYSLSAWLLNVWNLIDYQSTYCLQYIYGQYVYNIEIDHYKNLNFDVVIWNFL